MIPLNTGLACLCLPTLNNVLVSRLNVMLLQSRCLSFSPQALIRCYCYEKYYNHAASAAAAAQRKFSSVPIYSFYHAYGSLMQGELPNEPVGLLLYFFLKRGLVLHLSYFLATDQIEEASVELETIRDSRDVSLCTLMALVFAEKKKAHPGRAAYAPPTPNHHHHHSARSRD